MFYRVKQFYLALTAKITKEDQEFIKTYLTIDEQALFKKLQISEQKHSINVAKDIQRHTEDHNNKERLIRLGLLHDIGKINVQVRTIHKVIIVILNNLTKGRLKKHHQNKKIHSYYYHGETGAQMLAKIGGYDEQFLSIIENHHNKKINNNPLLKTLQKWDDYN